VNGFFMSGKRATLAIQARKGGENAMKPIQTQKEMAKELNDRLQELYQEIEAMNREFEEILKGRRKQKPSVTDPFALLERMVDEALQYLERSIRWLVDAILP